MQIVARMRQHVVGAVHSVDLGIGHSVAHGVDLASSMTSTSASAIATTAPSMASTSASSMATTASALLSRSTRCCGLSCSFTGCVDKQQCSQMYWLSSCLSQGPWVRSALAEPRYAAFNKHGLEPGKHPEYATARFAHKMVRAHLGLPLRLLCYSPVMPVLSILSTNHR